MTKYYKIGLPLSLGHAALVALVYFGIASGGEAQAGLRIVPILIADVPVSFLIALTSEHGVLGGTPWLENIVFSPLFIDGILGSIWWYFLPKFFLPKRCGGIWGSRPNPPE